MSYEARRRTTYKKVCSSECLSMSIEIIATSLIVSPVGASAATRLRGEIRIRWSLFLVAKRESISLYDRFPVLRRVLAKHSLLTNVDTRKGALSIDS